VRELVNTVEMLVSLSESDTIQPEDLPERFGRTLIAAPNVSALPALEQENNILTKVKNSVLEREKELILKILAETNGNKAAAARKLGIQRSTLYEKLKKHNITTQSSD
jgi:DNA-binding NtrC family response regulator